MLGVPSLPEDDAWKIVGGCIYLARENGIMVELENASAQYNV